MSRYRFGVDDRRAHLLLGTQNQSSFLLATELFLHDDWSVVVVLQLVRQRRTYPTVAADQWRAAAPQSNASVRLSLDRRAASCRLLESGYSRVPPAQKEAFDRRDNPQLPQLDRWWMQKPESLVVPVRHRASLGVEITRKR